MQYKQLPSNFPKRPARNQRSGVQPGFHQNIPTQDRVECPGQNSPGGPNTVFHVLLKFAYFSRDSSAIPLFLMSNLK